MFFIADITRIVDQQGGYAVIDPIGTAEPGVVHQLVADDQQRPMVLRARQQGQQQGVQSGFMWHGVNGTFFESVTSVGDRCDRSRAGVPTAFGGDRSRQPPVPTLVVAEPDARAGSGDARLA